MNWHDMPMWMRGVFVATLITMACQAVLANAQGEPDELQTPAEFCAAYTLPADRASCFQEYTAQRLYEQATDPTRAAISQAFPVLAVAAAGFLAWKLAGH